MSKKPNRSYGFTLLEIIIVIILVGGLASYAIPNYMTTIENTRKSEAINVLQALREAQILYEFETGSYTGSLAALDVTVPSLNHFNPPSLNGATGTVSIQRNDTTYTLSLDQIGNLTCTGAICAKLGFY